MRPAVPSSREPIIESSDPEHDFIEVLCEGYSAPDGYPLFHALFHPLFHPLLLTRRTARTAGTTRPQRRSGPARTSSASCAALSSMRTTPVTR